MLHNGKISYRLSDHLLQEAISWKSLLDSKNNQLDVEVGGSTQKITLTADQDAIAKDLSITAIADETSRTGGFGESVIASICNQIFNYNDLQIADAPGVRGEFQDIMAGHMNPSNYGKPNQTSRKNMPPLMLSVKTTMGVTHNTHSVPMKRNFDKGASQHYDMAIEIKNKKATDTAAKTSSGSSRKGRTDVPKLRPAQDTRTGPIRQQSAPSDHIGIFALAMGGGEWSSNADRNKVREYKEAGGSTAGLANKTVTYRMGLSEIYYGTQAQIQAASDGGTKIESYSSFNTHMGSTNNLVKASAGGVISIENNGKTYEFSGNSNLSGYDFESGMRVMLEITFDLQDVDASPLITANDKQKEYYRQTFRHLIARTPDATTVPTEMEKYENSFGAGNVPTISNLISQTQAFASGNSSHVAVTSGIFPVTQAKIDDMLLTYNNSSQLDDWYNVQGYWHREISGPAKMAVNIDEQKLDTSQGKSEMRKKMSTELSHLTDPAFDTSLAKTATILKAAREKSDPFSDTEVGAFFDSMLGFKVSMENFSNNIEGYLRKASDPEEGPVPAEADGSRKRRKGMHKGTGKFYFEELGIDKELAGAVNALVSTAVGEKDLSGGIISKLKEFINNLGNDEWIAKAVGISGGEKSTKSDTLATKLDQHKLASQHVDEWNLFFNSGLRTFGEYISYLMYGEESMDPEETPEGDIVPAPDKFAKQRQSAMQKSIDIFGESRSRYSLKRLFVHNDSQKSKSTQASPILERWQKLAGLLKD